MKEQYLKFIHNLINSGVYKEFKVVTYSGKIPSYNQIYSSPHWSVRSKLKEMYHGIFKILLFKALGKPEGEPLPVSLYVLYRSKHDPDNIVGISKFFMDTFAESGYIPEDGQKYFKSITIVPAPDLPNNTVQFYIAFHNVNHEG